MRDIIKCAGSGEDREQFLRRLAIPDQWWFWNCQPAEEVRRLYVVHRGEIIGWMPVVGVEYIDEAAVIRWSDGSTRKIECGVRTVTQSPMHVIEPPIPYGGFRGFRYFDFDDFMGEQADLMPVLCGEA